MPWLSNFTRANIPYDTVTPKCWKDRVDIEKLFDYIIQFEENYGGANSFTLMHYVYTHQGWGVFYKISEAVLKFIEWVDLKYQREMENELMLIITSDHGLRYPKKNKYLLTPQGKNE